MAAADNTGRTGRPGGQQGPKRKGRRSSTGGPTRAVIERPARPRTDQESDTLTHDLTGLDVAGTDLVVTGVADPTISADAVVADAPADEAPADDAPADDAVAIDGTDVETDGDGASEPAAVEEPGSIDPVAPDASAGAAPTPPAGGPDRAERAAEAALPLAALDWASGGRRTKPAAKKAAAAASTRTTTARTNGRPVAPARERHRGRWAAFAAGVLVLGAGGAFLAFRAANDEGATSALTAPPKIPTSTAAATTAVPTTPAPTTAVPTTSGAPAPAAAPTTATAATTAAPATIEAPATTVAPVAVDVTALAADGTPQLDFFTPIRWAIFKDGRVTLLGKVPSQAVADTIATKAAAVVGPGNVEVAYEIDPAAPAPPSAPLYVRNTVQFDPDSTVVRPEFASLLNLGVTLMQQNAGVHIWVIGRADAVGSEADNLRLSGQRADSVINYLVGAGIDRSRLTAVPLGTGSALGDNTTEEGRALNRSVEFVIGGLLS